MKLYDLVRMRLTILCLNRILSGPAITSALQNMKGVFSWSAHFS